MMATHNRRFNLSQTASESWMPFSSDMFSCSFAMPFSSESILPSILASVSSASSGRVMEDAGWLDKNCLGIHCQLQQTIEMQGIACVSSSAFCASLTGDASLRASKASQTLSLKSRQASDSACLQFQHDFSFLRHAGRSMKFKLYGKKLAKGRGSKTWECMFGENVLIHPAFLQRIQNIWPNYNTSPT